MPIQFQTEYIERLNRVYEKGKFIRAAILTESFTGGPGGSPLIRYFVDHEEAITFQGHTYTPLHMYSERLKTGMGMETETAEVALSNVGNQVVKYLREVDISEMPCTLQLLHLDLLGSLTQFWHRTFKILGVRADQTLAVFMLGREIGRNQLPRDVLTAAEAPGLSSEVPRF